MKNKLRLYLDTSVFGGYFDKEFLAESRRVVDGFIHKKGILLASPVLLLELENAPNEIKRLLMHIPIDCVENIIIDKRVDELAKKYLSAKVIPIKSINDSIHVALATVNRADAIVSWNFKHIVRLDRIKGFNRVNHEMGHRDITIITPQGVVFHE